jgi:TonB family protein
MRIQARSYGARTWGERSAARGELPFGPVSRLVPDTVFSVLEVDRMVERFEGSAAPVYPRDLLALGTEGLVRATYVVDTTGRVDTTTIQVMISDDPRFTESVRTALGQMLFRPAKRAGRSVRQLVEQQFRFRIAPPSGSPPQSS